ncbi:hypothetical protein SRABI118_04161 [Massilia sp. Bi118]|uniref:PEP-CTERM sorting domain-containing protein n=1 Tax=Massilia sp. Bi118 TaxID=2822346 RepID=UPI001D941A7C|nr:PEP-CTERM sorting domain-containing protein [Massilia sp. Bi118]CAH0293860.1 hypothetical protein SRABI118_04161 [Massilia sp. Bi118]
MYTKLAKVLAAAVGVVGMSCAQATVLDFENVANINNYQGFSFNNAGAIVASDYPSYQGVAQGLVSGTHVGFNPTFGTTSFSSATSFAFNSGYFTSFDGSGTPLVISAYLNGALLGSQTFQITDQHYTLINLNQSLFGNVTSVSFTNDPNAVVFDDLTVNASAVPEPGSLALLGIAMAGLLGAGRRKHKSA